MKNKDGTFQQDIQCIIQPVRNCGGIFISNIQAASNPLTLKKHNITAVLSTAKGKNLQSIMPKHIQYMYIPAIDHQQFDISAYFDETYQFINQECKRTNVLVHCMAGVSRSVTIVIAYLMRSKNMICQQAYSFVKSKRKIIHPNESFMNQLKQLQVKLSKNNKKHLIQAQSSKNNWFSKDKDNTSTGSSWTSPQRPLAFQRPSINSYLDSYDLNLRTNIKLMFQVKNRSKYLN